MNHDTCRTKCANDANCYGFAFRADDGNRCIICEGTSWNWRVAAAYQSEEKKVKVCTCEWGTPATGAMCQRSVQEEKCASKLMFPTFETHMKLTGEFALTAAECEQYAMSVGASWNDRSGQTNGPTGCGRNSNSNIVYWFPDGIQNCEYSGITCIRKAPFERVSGAATDLMSPTECQAYAAGNGYTFGVPSITFNVWSAGTQTYYKQSVAANRYYTGYYWANDCGTTWFSTQSKECCNCAGYSYVAKTSVTPVIDPGRTFSSEEDPSGCFLHDGNVYFNTNSNSNTCGGDSTCLSFSRGDAYEQATVAPDLSMSQAECEAYAAKQAPDKTFTVLDNNNANPSGCFYHSGISNQNYFYNTATNIACDAIKHCIQKPIVVPMVWKVTSGAPDLSMSQGECQAYAGGSWGGGANVAGAAPGCITFSGYYWYNTGSGECSSGYKCIQKASAVEVIESGTPDLSMSQGECQAYGESIGKWDSAAGNSGHPKGCFDSILEGGKVRYNNDASGGDCDVNSYYRCLQKVEFINIPCGAEYVYDVAADACTSAVGKMLTTDGTTWVDVPVGAVRTGEDTWATGNAAIESAWYSHAYCDSQAKAEENYHPDDPVSATPAALDATKVGLILATKDPIAWYQPQVGKVYLGNGVFLDCPIYSMRVGNSCSDQKAAFENAWDSQCA